MSKAHVVRMRIESIVGTCPNGHQVGEEYVVGNKTVAGICMGSFNSCAPYLTALRFGASFPWEKEEGTFTIGCADHINQVVWRMERVQG
jgi:uncharacterized repeat protein (TIGR04076 family)